MLRWFFPSSSLHWCHMHSQADTHSQIIKFLHFVVTSTSNHYALLSGRFDSHFIEFFISLLKSVCFSCLKWFLFTISSHIYHSKFAKQKKLILYFVSLFLSFYKPRVPIKLCYKTTFATQCLLCFLHFIWSFFPSFQKNMHGTNTSRQFFTDYFKIFCRIKGFGSRFAF